MKDLKKIISIGIIIASLACLLVMWSMFFTMWLHGVREITLYVDYFGEFWIEFIGLTIAIIFFPVLIYEIDEMLLND